MLLFADVFDFGLDAIPLYCRYSEKKMRLQQTEAETKPEWLQIQSAEAAHGTDEDFPSSADGGGGSSPPSFLRRAQSLSGVASIVLSAAAVVLAIAWATALGGVSWREGESKRVFNWHPVLMVTGYAFMTVGALLFRVSGTSSHQASARGAAAPEPKKRSMVKLAHATMWSLCFVCGIVAMLAVFKSHNDPISGYIANLYSFHSWVGVFVLSLYTLQLLVGIIAFGGLSLTSGRGRVSKAALMEVHKCTGAYIHILATATIMLGIQEKEGFVGCGYAVDSADLVPFANLGKIPHPCKISHGLGLVVLAIGLCTSFGLARFPVCVERVLCNHG